MEEQIQFLKELQATMKYENEHDYDGQASPRFWVIMDYRTVPGHEDYDSGFDSYFHNDGDLSEFRDFEELKDFVEEHCWEEVEDEEYLQELLSDETKDIDTLWAFIENNLNDDGYFSKVLSKKNHLFDQTQSQCS